MLIVRIWAEWPQTLAMDHLFVNLLIIIHVKWEERLQALPIPLVGNAHQVGLSMVTGHNLLQQPVMQTPPVEPPVQQEAIAGAKLFRKPVLTRTDLHIQAAHQ